METKKIDSVIKGFTRVLLKAYGNKPIIRYASIRNDGIIMVKSEKSLSEIDPNYEDMDWIGWPPNDVFIFNQDSYNKLTKLYQDNFQDELIREWNEQKIWH